MVPNRSMWTFQHFSVSNGLQQVNVDFSAFYCFQWSPTGQCGLFSILLFPMVSNRSMWIFSILLFPMVSNRSMWTFQHFTVSNGLQQVNVDFSAFYCFQWSPTGQCGLFSILLFPMVSNRSMWTFQHFTVSNGNWKKTINFNSNPSCCIFLASCDFQDSQCGYTNDGTGRLRWYVESGKTSTPGTGPSIDHTFLTDKGWDWYYNIYHYYP